MRARLVTLLAAHRPASADRPTDQPGAAARQSTPTEAGVVPEVLGVSEWLAHELQMAHPYSWAAAQALVETSLVLTGRLAATLGLLGCGRIDYRRAQILADLLSTCSTQTAHTVQAMVLPRAPGLTPGGLDTAIRRALAHVDAAAVRRRHAAARKSADVRYWPSADGMARLVADLPLPVAAACCHAITRYAKSQQADGDTRPVGQILPDQPGGFVPYSAGCARKNPPRFARRTETLTDLILRPGDTSRPAVTAEVTVHLTIPTHPNPGTRGGPNTGGGLDEAAAQAEVDGQHITAAHCRELLGQLDASRIFLALHDAHRGLTAVATPTQLRRAARRRNRGADGPGLRPPAATPGYRPTRAQDRHVRTRDRTCRHFGCTRKATHADLDHHQRWPAGPTTACNLCAYFRTHHRLKHQAPGWTRALDPDATLTISTPTGTTRTTRPPGPETPIEATDLHPATPSAPDAARPTPPPADPAGQRPAAVLTPPGPTPNRDTAHGARAHQAGLSRRWPHGVVSAPTWSSRCQPSLCWRTVQRRGS